jgi:hypothetical protein
LALKANGVPARRPSEDVGGRTAPGGHSHFDAFQNDYAKDTFTALASEIVVLAEEQRKVETDAAKVFLEKAVGAGKILLRSCLKLDVKAATLGALDGERVASDVAQRRASSRISILNNCSQNSGSRGGHRGLLRRARGTPGPPFQRSGRRA